MLSESPQPVIPDVSVIILTYNVRELALDCVESVKKASEGLGVEIIVSDNHSSDGTVEAVRQKYPDVVVVENNENRGFSAGNNRGIDVSRGKHLLILNPDTVVDRDALTLTYEFAENHPECGVVGCKVLNPDGTVQQSWFGHWSLFYAFWIGVGLQQVLPVNHINGRWTFSTKTPEGPVRVGRLLGCFLWMKREVVDRVGMFDESFFLYGEEDDLSRRIRDYGFEVCYYPGAQIVHLGGRSTRNVTELSRIQANISKMRFVKKHWGWWGRVVFLVWWTAALLVRVMVRLPLSVFSPYQGKIGRAEWKSIGGIWGV
jgi:GT2 family glycosyltransferase